MGVDSVALRAKNFKIIRRKPVAYFLLATVAFWALYAIWLGFRLGGEEGLRYLSDVVYEVPLVVATVTLGRAAARTSGRARIGWALAASGMAAWAVAEWAWSSYDLFFRAEVPLPSLADPLYYLGYLGMTAALVVLVQPDSGWQGLGKSFFDVLIVIIVLATLSWHWVLAPIAKSSDVSLLGVSVTLGYPLMDLAMVTVVVTALYRTNWRLPAPIVYLALAELISAVSDTLFLHLSVVQNYDPIGNPVELGWVVAYSLSAMAGFLQWQRQGLVQAGAGTTWERYSWLGLSLPYALALPLLGLLIQGAAKGSPSLVVVVGSTLVLACLGLRQWFALVENVLQRRRAEAVRERLAAILEATPDFVSSAKVDGSLLYINNAGRKMLGIGEDEDISNMKITDFLPQREHARQLGEAIPVAIQSGAWSGEVVLRHREGGELPVSMVGLAHKGPDGTVEFLSCVARDISERKRYEEQLTHLASHDPLTDLYNRRRFQEDLEHQLAQARRYGNHGALLLLDLDYFKDINDSLGHRAGDVVLISLSGLLREQLRETDTLARLGGDEFAILLPQADADQAQTVAEHILEVLRQHTVTVGGQPTGATASIGIALFPEHGASAEDLLAHADLAMYRAKENGRDSFCLYTPDRDRQEQIESRFAWERRIREALEKDGFLLYCQPILGLHDGRPRYEVLLRMVGEGGEVILPGQFLPIAERFGLIHAIDRWVVRRSIHLLAEQERAGKNLCLEINLSARAFEDSELLPLIQRELAASGIDPAKLTFEITETAVIADVGQAQKFISALKGLGCHFAIDDFGVGFSSFYYLKHLPVDYLKIDGDFIRNLPRDPVDHHLVKAIAEVARGLGKETIAEFVGDEETVQLLRESGVDYAQGYHIGRPLPATEILSGCEAKAEEEPEQVA